MSIRNLGRATLSFIIGTRLWPPAKSLASSPWRRKSSTASSRPPGLKYSKIAGYICLLLYVLVAHRIELARANLLVGFFDEREIVDLIERHRPFDAARRADRAHLLAHAVDVRLHDFFGRAARLRYVRGLPDALAPDFHRLVEIVQAQHFHDKFGALVRIAMI